MNSPTEIKFDLFLSHNSADTPMVEHVARKLESSGNIKVWLDSWQLGSGTVWQDKLEEALSESQGCAVFLGPNGLAPWQLKEMRVANVLHSERPNYKIIPVVLPGGDGKSFPLFIRSNFNWVDFRVGIDNDKPLHQFITSVTGGTESLDTGKGAEDGADKSPFKGLSPFEESDEKYFVGRELFIEQQLVEHLRHSRFLAIVGMSGSGKSSVVRAGLIPALRKDNLIGSNPIITMKPSQRPLEELAVALLNIVPNNNLARFIEDLSSNERTLHLAFRNSPTGSQILFIDQFEEIFTLTNNENEREAFFKNLVYAATLSDSPLRIVITMRSDFLSKCAAYRDINMLICENLIQIPKMGNEELRRVIVEPARSAHLDYEEGLVDTILADVAGASASLPLLQHTLLSLWQKRSKNLLISSAYKEIGGVQGSLAQHAEELLDRLSVEEQKTVRQFFLRLVSLGEGTEDTRRRVNKEELLSLSGDAELLLSFLTDNRLITSSRDPVTGIETYEIIHEALIRGWPRLAGWLDEDRDFNRFRQRLTEDVREWKKRGNDESELYRGAHLLEAIDYLGARPNDLTQVERDFIIKGRELHEKEIAKEKRTLLRFRRLAVGLAVLVIAIGVVAYWANHQRRLAMAREMVAQLKNMEEADPALRLKMAIEAYEINPDLEAQVELRKALMGANEKDVFHFPQKIESAKFTPDSKYLLVFGEDSLTWMINLATKKIVSRYPYHVAMSEISPDGKTICTYGESDSVIRIWSIESGKIVKTLSLPSNMKPQAEYFSIGKWSQNGHLLVNTEDHSILFYDINRGLIEKTWQSNSNNELTGKLNKSGTRILIKSLDKQTSVYVLNLIDGQSFDQVNQIYSGSDKEIKKSKYRQIWSDWNFSQEGKFIFWMRFELGLEKPDSGLRVLDGITGKLLYSYIGKDNWGIVFSSDDSLISHYDGKNMKVIDTKVFNIVSELQAVQPYFPFEFDTADGEKWIWATTPTSNDAHLISLASGREAPPLPPHNKHGFGKIFSPNGKYGFWAGTENTIWLSSSNRNWMCARDVEIDGGESEDRIFSGKQNHMYIFTDHSGIFLYDIYKRKILSQIENKRSITRYLNIYDLAPEYFGFITDDHRLTVFDAENEKLLYSSPWDSTLHHPVLLSNPDMIQSDSSIYNAHSHSVWVKIKPEYCVKSFGLYNIRKSFSISRDLSRAIFVNKDSVILLSLPDQNILKIMHFRGADVNILKGDIFSVRDSDGTGLYKINDGQLIWRLDHRPIKFGSLYGHYTFDSLIEFSFGQNENVIYNAHTAQRLSKISGNWVGFSRTGKYGLTEADGRITIWDVISGEAISTIGAIPSAEYIDEIRFSPDYKCISVVTNNKDDSRHYTRIAYVNPDDVLRAAKEKLKELESRASN